MNTKTVLFSLFGLALLLLGCLTGVGRAPWEYRPRVSIDNGQLLKFSNHHDAALNAVTDIQIVSDGLSQAGFICAVSSSGTRLLNREGAIIAGSDFSEHPWYEQMYREGYTQYRLHDLKCLTDRRGELLAFAPGRVGEEMYAVLDTEGRLVWSKPIEVQYPFSNFAASGDLDDDGTPEHVFESNRSLACYDHTGKKLWTVDLGPLVSSNEQTIGKVFVSASGGSAKVMVLTHQPGTITAVHSYSIRGEEMGIVELPVRGLSMVRWHGREYMFGRVADKTKQLFFSADTLEMLRELPVADPLVPHDFITPVAPSPDCETIDCAYWAITSTGSFSDYRWRGFDGGSGRLLLCAPNGEVVYKEYFNHNLHTIVAIENEQTGADDIWVGGMSRIIGYKFKAVD